MVLEIHRLLVEAKAIIQHLVQSLQQVVDLEVKVDLVVKQVDLEVQEVALEETVVLEEQVMIPLLVQLHKEILEDLPDQDNQGPVEEDTMRQALQIQVLLLVVLVELEQHYVLVVHLQPTEVAVEEEVIQYPLNLAAV